MSHDSGVFDMKDALPEQATTLPEQAATLPEQAATLPEQAATLPEQAAALKRPDKPAGDWGKPVAFDYTETDVDRQWGSNGVVYEWDGEEGEVAPENKELEIQLFGRPEERYGAGVDISKITEITVDQEGQERVVPIFDFGDAGLHPIMLKNIEMCGYKMPTPIQSYCIPAIKMGCDLIAIAQTGSGKTAAYLIPILNHLMGKAKKLAAPRPTRQEFAEDPTMYVRAEPLVLIVCPTRELAVQIFDEARKFCYRTMLRPCVIYGGGPLPDQLRQIGRGCDLLIATPGRLLDIMERTHLFTLRRLRYMVVDEADELLDLDWQDDFQRIFSGGDLEEGDVKYMLFSATFPAAVRKIAKEHLAMNHVRIHVGRIGSTHGNIKQDVIFVRQELKKNALTDLLYSMEPGRTIIFVNSKRMADELDDFLFHKGLPCTSMHSDRTQREREDAMRAFRFGKTPILIATGVSARGIDVRNVVHVINYDLPSADHGGIQEYTHRIGRTGRIGHIGYATSFYTDRDEPLAEALTKTLMETKQAVPDFLQCYIPEGVDPSTFVHEADESEDEGEGKGENGGDAWGANGGDTWGADDSKPAEGEGENRGDAWGANDSKPAEGEDGLGGVDGNGDVASTAQTSKGKGVDSDDVFGSGPKLPVTVVGPGRKVPVSGPARSEGKTQAEGDWSSGPNTQVDPTVQSNRSPWGGPLEDDFWTGGRNGANVQW
ncbi:P-loop containing nucleoside triphosphate hydrolase protein [Hypoxylon sp. FL0543]|nr:P-loop containing nucleoside triphosphate hydrolase protein [Hypoxylon sp. FL0543]